MSKRSLVAIILILCMSLSLLVGCGENEGATEGDNSEVSSVAEEVNSEETVSEEVSETVSEEAGEEMTIEEIIASEIPAKLEVGEDEVIVPATVTAEQILARWEEVKKVPGDEYDEERAESLNRSYLAGLLYLNCSYMEPDEFQMLVNEYFEGDPEKLLSCCINEFMSDMDEYGIYDFDYIKPSDLLFDEYLINQAEQVEYLAEKYNVLKVRATPEPSPVLAPVDEIYLTYEEDLKICCNIIADYIFGEENKYMTFDCFDERLGGSSGEVWIFPALFMLIRDDMFEYDPKTCSEFMTGDKYSEIMFINYDIVREQYNK
ncbi:MAG: hypothetical protein J6A80_07095 [Lachnospiraceae bacterium]|nr:hypothetical protein [Lachnospiraceae bacterium]